MNKKNNSLRIRFLLIFTVLCFFTAPAQVSTIDSLELVLQTRKLTNYERINICNDLSRILISINFPKAKKFAYTGIVLAKKEANNKMLASLYRNLGGGFTFAGVYDSAAYFLDSASMLAKEVNDQSLQAYVLLGVATLNTRINNYQLALEQFFKVLAMFEKTGDKSNIRKTLGSIAALYMYQENYAHAEKYYLLGEKVALEIGDSSGLGQIYQGLSRTSLIKKEMSKALDYAKKSAAAFHASKETGYESVAMKEIANIYLVLNDVNRSTEYASYSLKLARISQTPRYISNSLIVLSDIAFYKKNYKECIDYALQAIHIDSSDSDTKTRMLENLVKASVSNNQNDEAVSYFQQYRHVIDSRINETYQKSLSEMEVKYETDKKEFRIASLENEKRLSIILIIAGVTVFLFLFLFLYMRAKNQKQKKELAEQKIVQLEQEKKLIATQSVLDGETAERTRLARDLHDGLGGMLSVMKLHLYDVKKEMKPEGESEEHFNLALDMLETSTKELRRVAHNLMPESLSSYGLKASLQDFLSSIPQAKLHYFGEDVRIDPKLEIVIYRTAHELVNNALKHSDAKNINVQIVQQPDSISLTVQDDGKGFDVSAVKNGYGLKSIQSRIATFNGSVNIFSETGQGTEINVEFKTGVVV